MSVKYDNCVCPSSFPSQWGRGEIMYGMQLIIYVIYVIINAWSRIGTGDSGTKFNTLVCTILFRIAIAMLQIDDATFYFH